MSLHPAVKCSVSGPPEEHTRNWILLGLISGSQRLNVPPIFRGVSQVLSDLANWNESPVVISTLPNRVRVTTRLLQLVCALTHLVL